MELTSVALGERYCLSRSLNSGPSPLPPTNVASVSCPGPTFARSQMTVATERHSPPSRCIRGRGAFALPARQSRLHPFAEAGSGTGRAKVLPSLGLEVVARQGVGVLDRTVRKSHCLLTRGT
jgi:hypothetical protein